MQLRSLEPVVTGLCAYEVLALTTRRVPPLTVISRRYRIIAPILVGGLAVHLYRAAVDKVAGDIASAITEWTDSDPWGEGVA